MNHELHCEVCGAELHRNTSGTTRGDWFIICYRCSQDRKGAARKARERYWRALFAAFHEPAKLWARNTLKREAG